jgi:N-acetylmuramoyl-L-alanine amidase
MAKLICLQAGHEGVTTGATGAPGEQELNVRIRNRLSQILISKGFQVQLVNANPPSTEINKDFSLFLALHGDANIYGTGGGFIDHPDPSTDAATAESQRIDLAMESEYFDHSGIVNHPERSNPNTKFYYMWAQLSAKTPCVIMEMGVVQDAHDKVLLADTERIASAIARGICKAFNVAFDPPPIDPTIALNQKIKDLENLLAKSYIDIGNLKGRLTQIKEISTI